MSRQVTEEYRALIMMRARIKGKAFKEIAAMFGGTPASASVKINRMASECMRDAMRKTQSDPDHPAVPRFKLEDFTADPRGAMVEMMNDRIALIEKRYPGVTGETMRAPARATATFAGKSCREPRGGGRE